MTELTFEGYKEQLLQGRMEAWRKGVKQYSIHRSMLNSGLAMGFSDFGALLVDNFWFENCMLDVPGSMFRDCQFIGIHGGNFRYGDFIRCKFENTGGTFERSTFFNCVFSGDLSGAGFEGCEFGVLCDFDAIQEMPWGQHTFVAARLNREVYKMRTSDDSAYWRKRMLIELLADAQTFCWDDYPNLIAKFRHDQPMLEAVLWMVETALGWKNPYEDLAGYREYLLTLLKSPKGE